ncbi:MAG TPA: hypothetical protein VEY12_10305, partial [Thermoplasmata archaeon]|nr:hypothetical protein [Thermoplasmata archaeon]
LLDSRVRSRMGTASVYFPPYREDEILAIIEGRRDAFRPETLAPGVLRRCARLAAEEHGDARRALDLLRTAGEVADAEGAARVELCHVERADTVLQAERTTRVIQDLPIQEIVLVNALSLAANEAYGTIADEGKVTPPENPAVPTDVVFKRYCRQAAFWNLCPKGRRRFLDFLQDLEMHGLIGSATESSGRYGRRKLVWILGDPINIGYAAHYHLVHQCRPDLMMYAVGAPSDY